MPEAYGLNAVGIVARYEFVAVGREAERRNGVAAVRCHAVACARCAAPSIGQVFGTAVEAEALVDRCAIGEVVYSKQVVGSTVECAPASCERCLGNALGGK